MKFPCTFVRTVAGSGTVLGSDATPSGPINAADNVLSTPIKFDRPVNRIAIGYTCSGAGSTLTVDVWQYDATNNVWYKLKSSATSLPLNVLTPIGVIGGQPPQAGVPLDLQFYIQVHAAGGDAAGTYTFAVTPDEAIGTL